MIIHRSAGGGGASTLEALLAPGSAKNVPRSNGSAWVAAQLAMSDLSAYALTNLSDATITTPAVKHVLRYSGSAWVNQQLAMSDLSAYGINNLSDVNTGTPADGDFLYYKTDGYYQSHADHGYGDTSAIGPIIGTTKIGRAHV